MVQTYLLGPILALFPTRWRKSLPVGFSVEWRPATMLSGFAESVSALIAMVYWYSYSVTTWVDRALEAALNGKSAPGVTDHQIGFVAVAIFATHPLTWWIAYCGVEGMVRLVSAAFTETNPGILPLFVLDKLFVTTTGRGKQKAANGAVDSKGNFSSYVGAIREKVMAARTPEVPDEHSVSRSEPDEMLEIRACRRKVDWTPPRTVRYRDAFYRLEECSEESAPRPFRYTLRRLTAGVMGRTVLVYAPEKEPVLTKK